MIDELPWCKAAELRPDDAIDGIDVIQCGNGPVMNELDKFSAWDSNTSILIPTLVYCSSSCNAHTSTPSPWPCSTTSINTKHAHVHTHLQQHHNHQCHQHRLIHTSFNQISIHSLLRVTPRECVLQHKFADGLMVRLIFNQPTCDGFDSDIKAERLPQRRLSWR